jgi:hypothetical protein
VRAPTILGLGLGLLAIAVAQTATPTESAQAESRTVVFEAFHGSLSANCRTAGRIIDILDDQYRAAGHSVIFLEHDVDSPDMGRLQRWAASGGSGVIPLPYVMTDSGYRWSYGPEGYRSVYARMVDQSLERRAEASIEAHFERSDNSLLVQVDVVNESGDSLGTFNDGTVWAIVYEEKRVFHTGRFVRGFASEPIAPVLRPDQRGSYELSLSELPVDDWDNAHVVALVDFIANTDGGYEMLQAAEAAEGIPTATPTRATATASPAPATPSPAAATTASPGATATPEGTPVYRDAYLPRVLNEP